jgi:hypothetical protein
VEVPGGAFVTLLPVVPPPPVGPDAAGRDAQTASRPARSRQFAALVVMLPLMPAG